MAEKDYTKPIKLPFVRLRFHLITSQGVAVEFLIQLEYNYQLVDEGPDQWAAIARFDHNPHSHDGHDVRKEGLHLDLLDIEGEKLDVRRGFPYIPIDNCPEYCEKYLISRAQKLVLDHERRYDISDGLYSR